VRERQQDEAAEGEAQAGGAAALPVQPPPAEPRGEKISESVREPLAQTADGIGADAKTLRGALHCPADAAGT
jgi:hypothetical protein